MAPLPVEIRVDIRFVLIMYAAPQQPCVCGVCLRVGRGAPCAVIRREDWSDFIVRDAVMNIFREEKEYPSTSTESDREGVLSVPSPSPCPQVQVLIFLFQAGRLGSFHQNLKEA